MTDRRTRWAVSLHEAAHVVCGMAFAHEAARSAQLAEDGRRGIALQPAGLSDRQSAIFAAAGACGEMYASRWPVPKVKRQKPSEPQSVEAIRQKAVAETFSDHARDYFTRRGLISDNEFIGRYCVSLHPDAPNEWEGDVRRVQADATKLVRRHKTLLLAIATELFRAGFYFVEASATAASQRTNQKTENQK